MQRSILFLFFALFATALGQTFQPKRCNVGQKKADVAVIRQQFKHRQAVCNWYLSSRRNRVPTLKTFTAPTSDRAINRFSAACECIAKKRRSTKGTPRVARPANFTPKCNERARGLLAVEVKQPKQFCLLWSQLKWRKNSAVPFGSAMNIRQIYNACECALNPVASTTDSEEPTTTDEPESSTTDEPEESSTTDDAEATTTDDSATTTTDVPVTTTPIIVLPTTTPLLPTTTDLPTTTSSSSSTTSTSTTTTTTTTTTTSTTTTASASATGANGILKKKMMVRRGRQYSNAGKLEVVAN